MNNWHQRITVKIHIKWVGAILCLFCTQYSYASPKACTFSDSYLNRHPTSINIDMTNVSESIFDDITDIPSAPKLLGTRQVDLLDREDAVTCSNNDGDNRFIIASVALQPGYDQGLDPQGRRLVLVNIRNPGLAYSVEIACIGADSDGDCKGHSGDTIPVTNSDTTWATQNGTPWDDRRIIGRNQSGDNFKVNVYFWQLPTWVPTSYGSGVIAGSNFQIFSFTFSATGRRLMAYINVSLKEKTPTCDSAVTINGQGTSANINLGNDITPQQLSADDTAKVPFTIELKNCNIVNNVFVRLNTTKIDSNDDSLLGKQSGSATGVGVKITDNDANVVKPNDSTSKLTYPYAGSLSNRVLNLNAQLVSNGLAVQPGNFQASGTFTVSYD